MTHDSRLTTQLLITQHGAAAHGMEVGGAADLKLQQPAPEAPMPTDASKRVIYQDKMADQDAPQR